MPGHKIRPPEGQNTRSLLNCELEERQGAREIQDVGDLDVLDVSELVASLNLDAPHDAVRSGHNAPCEGRLQLEAQRSGRAGHLDGDQPAASLGDNNLVRQHIRRRGRASTRGD